METCNVFVNYIPEFTKYAKSVPVKLEEHGGDWEMVPLEDERSLL
jgi:hypothetical protein